MLLTEDKEVLISLEKKENQPFLTRQAVQSKETQKLTKSAKMNDFDAFEDFKTGIFVPYVNNNSVRLLLRFYTQDSESEIS